MQIILAKTKTNDINPFVFVDYIKVPWSITESNRRPLDCQSNALAN